jgi:hypothetical protein
LIWTVRDEGKNSDNWTVREEETDRSDNWTVRDENERSEKCTQIQVFFFQFLN